MQTYRSARREDDRLLTGQGRFLSDFVTRATIYAAFLRADAASATIETLDVSEAESMPGVLAVFTAADLSADGIGPMQHVELPREDGGTAGRFPQPILCDGLVRHIGEPIAMIIADTQGALADAIDAMDVDLRDAAPIAGVAFHRRFGDDIAAVEALKTAHHSHRITLDIPRVTAFPLEPRGAIAGPDGAGGVIYRASTQNPFALRDQICGHMGWDPEKLRVLAGDVGGSFGLKGYMTREDAALAWAAKRLGREIAWLPARSEAMLADAQGRGVSGRVDIGLDANLKIVALDADFDIDVGAYPERRSFGLMNNMNGFTGMYRIARIAARVTGRLSAKAPLAPFRGNGRPEATYAIERALDLIARRIGVDPVDLRRRNLIGPEEMPAITALGTKIDCGDFPRVLMAALALNGPTDARRKAAETAGRLYGVGLANCIESSGGPLRQPKPDCARITVCDDGQMIVAPGVMSVGQGHETVLSRMAADRLEIDVERIAYRHGDTDAIAFGRGSGGSSGLTVAGSAMWQALDLVRQKGGAAAAEVFGCSAEQIVYRDGAFQHEGSNENLTLAEIAATMPDGRWQVETSFTPPAATFPNGTHICEVEIDPDTGAVRVVRYAAVEDVGRVLNTTLVEGQLHGGIAQGLSLGLGERMIFDEAGQILSGTLMDYTMIRASDLPMISLGSVEEPTGLNPLGVKGVGEAGAVGATAALASAVGDALHRAGAVEFELPATPARVWQALQEAKRG